MKKNKGLQAVTHPSTDQAQCCLTSVIKGLVALAVCNTLGALAATFRTKNPVVVLAVCNTESCVNWCTGQDRVRL